MAFRVMKQSSFFIPFLAQLTKENAFSLQREAKALILLFQNLASAAFV